MSLMMVLPHRPGTLYGALSKIYALGLNVRKMESRPMPDRDFEFMFYFDVEASVYAPETEKLFRDLEASSERLRFLGAYSEILTLLTNKKRNRSLGSFLHIRFI
jgi:chorismate mutase/prephenate dehydratase